MGKREIARKLIQHLAEHSPFTEECHAVYLMIEIRKFLDQMENERHAFELLRFYCDWTVHTQKDRHMEHIAPIMVRIYKSVRAEISGYREPYVQPPIIGFLRMEDLKGNMTKFCRTYDIDPRLVEINESWEMFVKLLSSVLADQPIRKPTKSIEEFSFLPAENGHIRGYMVFAEPIEGPDKQKHKDYAFGMNLV